MDSPTVSNSRFWRFIAPIRKPPTIVSLLVLPSLAATFFTLVTPRMVKDCFDSAVDGVVEGFGGANNTPNTSPKLPNLDSNTFAPPK